MSLITVVTVVYNSRNLIEKTLKSVISQSYENIEYIVVDGDSFDGTKEIIKQYEEGLSYWLSEKDNGIYDAMNKAINLATGDWIIFLNSGDVFSSDRLIESIFLNKKYDGISFLYGDVVADYGGFSKYYKAQNPPVFSMKMPFNHQSVFIRSELHKRKKFNLEYKLGADYEFLFTSFVDGAVFHYLNMPIAVVAAGGLSDSNRRKVLQERFNILKKYSPGYRNTFDYIRIIFMDYIRYGLKKLLPRRLIEFIKKNK